MSGDSVRGISSSPERITLLIVDDDRAFREALRAAFERRGYEVRVASVRGRSARGLCETFVPERAVVDLRMAGASGLELIGELKRLDPATAIVVLTGYGSIPTAVEAMRRGATHYLTKPAEPDEIEAAFSGKLDSQCRRGAVARQGDLGTHAACSRGVQRKRVGSGKTPRNASAHLAAKALQKYAPRR